MSETLSLFDVNDGVPPATEGLELIRITGDEVALITFCHDVDRVDVHWCNELEISGYVRCNGAGCALCRAGKKPEPRVLLPVYSVAIQAVAVLAMSTYHSIHVRRPSRPTEPITRFVGPASCL